MKPQEKWADSFLSQCFCTDKAIESKKSLVECFYNKEAIVSFISQTLQQEKEKFLKEIVGKEKKTVNISWCQTCERETTDYCECRQQIIKRAAALGVKI